MSEIPTYRVLRFKQAFKVNRIKFRVLLLLQVNQTSVPLKPILIGQIQLAIKMT